MSIFKRGERTPVPDVEEQEELADLPYTPREGWTSVIALAVMMVTVGVAVDDSRWAGTVFGTSVSQTGFLPIAGLISVLVGIALAKSHLGPLRSHLIGAIAGAAYLLLSLSSIISSAPALEQRLRDINLSLSSFVHEVVVLGSRSSETSVFLLMLGALMWAAGQFAAFSVFRHRRPLPAVVLTGVLLLINVSLTLRDEYIHLVVFVAAALLLLVRLNLLEQAREWRARGMRDVADISGVFLRYGALFIVLALVGSTALAANASSAPLSRAWRDIDDELLEIGYEINRLLGGVSGGARGPNILFTPSQTLRESWHSSGDVVFTWTSSDGRGHRMRGATYDHWDGRTWHQLDRQAHVLAASEPVLGPSVESESGNIARDEVVVTVLPADYGGDVFVAPESPLVIDQPTEILTHGANGPFVAGKLSFGIDTGVPYTVRSLVRTTRGRDALTVSQLARAGTEYPSWVERYREISPGSVGSIVERTARSIYQRMPLDKRTPYHIAEAVQNYLYRDGGFEYTTDIVGVCGDRLYVDCFLETKRGFCERFATTMVMLLRQMRVPARYVLGYLPGREEDEGEFIVDESAAHAWVEVFFPRYGWVEFDPTPGNEENGQAPTQLLPGAPTGSLPPANPFPGGGELEFIDDPLAGGSETPEPPAATPVGPASDWRAAIVLVLILVAVAILGAVAAVRRIPGIEPEMAYGSVARLAARLGYGPRPAQTAYEFAAGLGELVPVARGDLNMIATAKVEATYARRRPTPQTLRILAVAYRRVRLGLLRLLFRRRPRGPRQATSR